MKVRKTFLTLTIVGFMALLLCLPGSAFAGPGPNPGGGESTKIIGPSPKAFLLVGWKPNLNSVGEETGLGTLEGFVWVDGMVFLGIPETEHPENSMVNALPEELTTWQYPPAIAQYFGFPEDTLVIIQKEGDVSNFEVITYIDPANPDQIWNPLGALSFSYKHILVCNVKFSFEVSR